MEKKVVGIYNDMDEVIRTINDLKDQGYTSDDISLITKDKKEYEHIVEETDTKIEKTAVTGAAAGGLLGAAAGLLAGIGAFAIPGIGPIIMAGPILATLGGATAGAGFGRLVGALIGMGLSEKEANEHVENIRNGKILLLVNRDENKQQGIHVTLRPSKVDSTKSKNRKPSFYSSI
ncbi:general stress protein [Actinomycetes bacterium NPDC127524]